jgi:DTW domain-containing protein YfiP
MASPRARASNRCARCAVRREHCICACLTAPIAAHARVVVVRHAREVWRPTNTGRIVVEALAGARLLTYGELDAPPFDAAALIAELPAPAWLLYPPDPGGETVPLGAPPPGALVVVDGTWSQTQRFVRRHPALASLPRCALPAEGAPGASRTTADRNARGTSLRLRHSGTPGRRLTAEAIASYLALWEDPARGAALERVHRAFVAATLAGRGEAVPDDFVGAP